MPIAPTQKYLHNIKKKYKTDKSERKVVCFWRELKLQPDRPHPDREVVLSKTDFNFFHT